MSLTPGAGGGRPRGRVAGVLCALLGAWVVAAAATVGPAACSSTAAVNASLLSGIFIPSSLLTDNQTLGCSDASALDVYTYVAVVINDRGDIGGAGIFPCYGSIVFANLPGIDAGSLNFAVWVYAYNAPDFAAANAGGALTTAVSNLNAVNRPDGSLFPLAATAVPEGGTDGGFFNAALSTICRAHATWVTTCSATSQASVQSLANCRPLTLEDAAASTCALPVLLPDASPDALPVP